LWKSHKKVHVSGRTRLPMRNEGTNFVSASIAT
jgi:hypothetical protein